MVRLKYEHGPTYWKKVNEEIGNHVFGKVCLQIHSPFTPNSKCTALSKRKTSNSTRQFKFSVYHDMQMSGSRLSFLPFSELLFSRRCLHLFKRAVKKESFISMHSVRCFALANGSVKWDLFSSLCKWVRNCFVGTLCFCLISFCFCGFLLQTVDSFVCQRCQAKNAWGITPTKELSPLEIRTSSAALEERSWLHGWHTADCFVCGGPLSMETISCLFLAPAKTRFDLQFLFCYFFEKVNTE